eukprot:223926-Amphidinium_carterae.1
MFLRVLLHFASKVLPQCHVSTTKNSKTRSAPPNPMHSLRSPRQNPLSLHYVFTVQPLGVTTPKVLINFETRNVFSVTPPNRPTKPPPAPKPLSGAPRLTKRSLGLGAVNR